MKSLYYLIILIANLSNFFTLCQNNTYSSNYDYSGTFGVGYGVIATVIAIFVGVFLCIYGWATTEPA